LLRITPVMAVAAVSVSKALKPAGVRPATVVLVQLGPNSLVLPSASVLVAVMASPTATRPAVKVIVPLKRPVAVGRQRAEVDLAFAVAAGVGCGLEELDARAGKGGLPGAGADGAEDGQAGLRVADAGAADHRVVDATIGLRVVVPAVVGVGDVQADALAGIAEDADCPGWPPAAPPRRNPRRRSGCGR
jgi:hypothetical protein